MDSEHKSKSSNVRLIVLAIFLLVILAGSLDYPLIWDKTVDYLNSKFSFSLPHFYKLPFRLGLDLQGGIHMIYEADLSDVEEKERQNSMEGIRDVIENRVDIFGVAEPVVQINKVKDSYRLIIELPGAKNTQEAIKRVGETPYVEFKEEKSQKEIQELLESRKEGDEELSIHSYFKNTLLTGRHLKKGGARLEFDQTTGQPQIGLEFTDEGKDIFTELTKRNINKSLAIYLDGKSIVDTTGDGKIKIEDDLYAPRIQEAITGGKAQITGDYSIDEAKTLVQRLNAGALPVPINLISQQSVGASLGEESLAKSLKATLIGLIAVGLFMILYYRLPGILAVFSLGVYAIIVLAIFKLIPVTLTLAGIAGFILSLGMAVDANVLIFERIKEELKSGKSLGGSINDGFKRAWPSIRDGNVSTLITAIILFWFGTSIIKGFALTLFIGVLASMFTAIVVTKTLLKLFVWSRIKNWKWLYGNY